MFCMVFLVNVCVETHIEDKPAVLFVRESSNTSITSREDSSKNENWRIIFCAQASPTMLNRTRHRRRRQAWENDIAGNSLKWTSPETFSVQVTNIIKNWNFKGISWYSRQNWKRSLFWMRNLSHSKTIHFTYIMQHLINDTCTCVRILCHSVFND